MTGSHAPVDLLAGIRRAGRHFGIHPHIDVKDDATGLKPDACLSPNFLGAQRPFPFDEAAFDNSRHAYAAIGEHMGRLAELHQPFHEPPGHFAGLVAAVEKRRDSRRQGSFVVHDRLPGRLCHEACVVRAKRIMSSGELQGGGVLHPQQHRRIFGGAYEGLRFRERRRQSADLPPLSLKPLHDHAAMHV